MHWYQIIFLCLVGLHVLVSIMLHGKPTVHKAHFEIMDDVILVSLMWYMGFFK